MFFALLGVWFSAALLYWVLIFCIEPSLSTLFCLKNRRLFGLLLVAVTIYVHIVEYFPWR